MKQVVAILIILPLGLISAGAISEDDYQAQFDQLVWPHYTTGEFGTFEGTGNLSIAYAKFEEGADSSALILLPGKSESFLKYAELIYDLRDCGYSLYLMDHRGMGFSDRSIQDDSDKVHIEEFDDYVSDVRMFIETVVNARPHKKMILLGHSLGGAVALRYLVTNSEEIGGAILCSPMIQIDTGGKPARAVYSFCRIAGWFGQGRSYAPGHGPWKTGVFDGNILTHSQQRWTSWREQLVPSYPQLQSGGPTNRWVQQSISAGWEILKDAHKVEVPILMLQAGLDEMVKPEGQQKVTDQLGRCELERFPDAYHEILMETDEIRDRALAMIRAFLSQWDDETAVMP